MLQKNKPPRLNKKVSRKQKCNLWLCYYAPYFIFLIFIIVCILFVLFIIAFIPGNDSAIVYNWGI